MAEWKPIETAPKDEWVLVRGYNSANRPMVPMVAKWMMRPINYSGPEYCWRDSGSLKPLLEVKEWMPLPSRTIEDTSDE